MNSDEFNTTKKKKNKIENFNVNSIWENKNISDKDYKKFIVFIGYLP